MSVSYLITPAGSYTNGAVLAGIQVTHHFKDNYDACTDLKHAFYSSLKLSLWPVKEMTVYK